ncbi:MAG: hypothetical protein CSA04_04795, partial [Bacteroidetes bacterium]
IIPDFGGLLLHYQPATVHPVTHVFSPPSKSLAFNRNLSVNDGLLANHIARKHQLSYDEVVADINLWVQQTRETLEASDQVTIEGIGTFSQDEEHTLQFMTDSNTNFYGAAYGLKPFASPAIIRKHTATGTALVAPLSTPSRRQRFRRIAAILLPAAILTGAALLSLFNQHPDKGVSYSGILVSCNRKTTPEEKTTPQPTPPAEESSTATGMATENEKTPDTTLYVKTGEHAETPPLVSKKKEPTTLQHGDASRDFHAKFKAPDTPEKRYYIIVGSYNTANQADQKVEALRINQYFDSYVINKSKKGTFRVSIESYVSLETAQFRLQTIRDEINKEAWLLRK